MSSKVNFNSKISLVVGVLELKQSLGVFLSSYRVNWIILRVCKYAIYTFIVATLIITRNNENDLFNKYEFLTVVLTQFIISFNEDN